MVHAALVIELFVGIAAVAAAAVAVDVDVDAVAYAGMRFDAEIKSTNCKNA